MTRVSFLSAPEIVYNRCIMLWLALVAATAVAAVVGAVAVVVIVVQE